jgi:outer membrane protein OmpA-like peptidoglycan-associated protein
MTRPRWFALFALVLALSLSSSAVAQSDGDTAKPADKTKEKAKDSSPDPGIQAPSIGGLTGLFRTITGDIGGRHTFRLGLHLEMFSASDFLVAGDSNSRFIATLAASYTPWKYLELFANARSMANDNERPDEQPARLDQQVILALGDFSFGGKFVYPFKNGLVTLGGNIGLTLLNSVGGVSIDGDSTSFYIGLISSLDLQKLKKPLPLRFHFNAGYLLDNSDSLAEFPGYGLASLQVEKFALGINPSRMRIRLGLEAPLQRWTKIGVTPILEFNFDIATASEDADFRPFVCSAARPTNCIGEDEFSGRLTSWMTFGVRVRPVRGLNLSLATDIGFTSPGYGFGPPVVPWNIILGFSYAYDPKPRVKTIERVRVRTVTKRVGKPVGKLRGRIINAKTLEPVDGAIVTFPGRDLTGLSSDPDGGFLSYGFPAGSLPVMVRHPRYKPARAKATIKVGAVVKIEVKLTPKPPRVGKLSGTVMDNKNKPVAATVQLAGPESKTITAGAGGDFALPKLKPGEYTATVTAPGYFRKMAKIKVAAGGTATLAFVISKKPKRSLVRVTRRKIVIKRKVHFATNTATIKPDSRQILDSVADVLLRRPNVRVEVQGHTDNRGSRKRNMTLSQARADAVRDYMLRAGVDGSRLVAKGYGPTRPKRPNITRRNRAINRRVEFKILK